MNNPGSALSATSGRENAGQIWLHSSSAQCPGFRGRVLLTAAGKDELAVSAGRRGVYQVAWIDALNEVQSTAVRVGCVRDG
jgi:hypothetical protein